MKRILFLGLVLALAAAAATAAHGGRDAAIGGTLYRVSLEAQASITVVGSAPAIPTEPYNGSRLTASWSIKTAPVQMWIAKVDGATVVTKASGSDSRGSTGTVHADDTFTWYRHDAPQTPLSGTSSCDANVQNNVTAKITAESTTGGVGIDVDFVGAFRTTGGAVVTCDNNPAEGKGDGEPTPRNTVFLLNVDPEGDQQIKGVASIQRFQIGERSIGPILTDASHVTDAPNCTNLSLTTCDVTFKLTGSLTMEKVCGGSVSVAGIGSCNGKNPTPPTKNPPPKGGGNGGGGAGANTPPVITGLKVTPHSVAASSGHAVISYHDSEPGTTTLIEVTHGSVAGHPIPVAIVKHVDSTASVTVPLPTSLAGGAYAPGAYAVVAMPVNAKGIKGKNVTATFVIAP
jgi:hypothetical protein